MLIHLLHSASVLLGVALGRTIDMNSDFYLSGMLANIGPSGSKAQGVPPGIVIASPSKNNPDYFYTWTRDSCLVFKAIIDRFSAGQTELQPHIEDFIQAEGKLQTVSNPSGTMSTGGLGEPKFNVDETAFTGAWGRPQRDGPALRAIALITYAGLTDNPSSLYSLVKADLDYVQDNWNQDTFDLWEEVRSRSFFTAAVQHRALRQGAAWAQSLKIPSVASGYSTAADSILCSLQSYWNLAGFINANTGGGRSGKDANTILASIHTFDPGAGCDSLTFQPCSDKALANLKVYIDSFRSIYAINNGIPLNASVATGRYFEDAYVGGNPWYLTTFAVAEQLYRALSVWKAQGSLTVTTISLPFFKQFNPDITSGIYPASSAVFFNLVNAVTAHADGFLAIVAKYTPSGGGLSEQYSRANGQPLSAADLTWSYAAGLTALDAKAGKMGASTNLGAHGISLPSSCSNGGSGGGGSGGNRVNVTFRETVSVSSGESIYIVGSISELKNWNPSQAILLTQLANSNVWTVIIDLPASTKVEYKYIRKTSPTSSPKWETDPNRQLYTGNNAFTENDVWR